MEYPTDDRIGKALEQEKQAAQYQSIRGIPAAPSGAIGRDIHYATENCCEAQSPYRPPTLREEAEKQVGYHRSEAYKAHQAVAFLRDNRAFDEFVRLVRAGVIQF
jgi:hypothetical protein